jgi:hypothetical protein
MSELRDLSPELKAAQELLYQKRAEARAERIRLGLPVDIAKERKGQGLTAEDAKNAEEKREERKEDEGQKEELTAKDAKSAEERIGEVLETDLAEEHIIQHLALSTQHFPMGWGSAAYSQLVRRSAGKEKEELTAEDAKSAEEKREEGKEEEGQKEELTAKDAKSAEKRKEGEERKEVAEQLPTTTPYSPLPTPSPSIRVFGHILDCLHRAGLDGPGRVWLLLRHLDPKGEGRVSLAQLRQALTEEGSSLKCLSWKRLRQLLAEGQGKLWARDTNSFDKLRTTQGWVYYFGEARIARLMNLKVIRGWAVEIPIQQLLGSIQEIRALFHDAFHSGRGDGFREPITRRIMESRGGGDGRTQRSYEKKRGITKRANFASLGRYTKAKWHHAQGAGREDGRIGGPAFTYVDYKGVLGKNPRKEYRAEHQQHWENIYIMRQVGNSYSGSLPTAKRGRKWTNRKLKHLCKSMPLTGTFEGEGESSGRFYYRDEETATKALLKGDKPLNYAQHPTAGAGGYWQELDLIRVAKEAGIPFEVVDNPSTSSGQAMDFYL